MLAVSASSTKKVDCPCRIRSEAPTLMVCYMFSFEELGAHEGGSELCCCYMHVRMMSPSPLQTPHAPGKDAVDGRKLARVGGDEAAHLREDRQDARLPEEGRLAWVVVDSLGWSVWVMICICVTFSGCWLTHRPCWGRRGASPAGAASIVFLCEGCGQRNCFGG